MRHFALSIRKANVLLALTVACLLTTACTANTSSTDEQGLRPRLAVDLKLPGQLSTAVDGRFVLQLMQGGQPVSAEQVTFEIWPEGQRDHRVTLPGQPVGGGVYTADYRPAAEGIYVVRSHAVSGKLEVMPSKRFAVGEQAVLHLATLEKQSADGQSDSAHRADGEHHDH